MERQAAYDAFWQMFEMCGEHGIVVTDEVASFLRILATQVAELELAVSTLFAELQKALNQSA
jgi:hypothetical protein